MHFDVLCLRFLMEADAPMYFPPGKAANMLRGAFGWILQQEDPHSASQLFSPKLSAGPSGLTDAPRPFVFRTAHLEGHRFAPGKRFPFGMNLFLDSEAALQKVVETFQKLERARLVSWSRAAKSVQLRPAQENVRKIRVTFLSPSEIKGNGGQILDEPDFGVMLCRIRDRVSTLRNLYGDGAVEMDFASFGERAAQVRLTRCELEHHDAERTSARTGQTHSLSGFTGIAEYEGDLDEFLPFLRAAAFTGVGRQTVWGKGEITFEKLA
ncbi:MAG: CRISPR system precrRNA processing endoribonuclease RAMP protein Cas6 [Acidobacteria bacterium]|nr:CRISPR system precrRNA processing endoribonuclease RAMP protein Cas6 [Acidobacteriota bacterium]